MEKIINNYEVIIVDAYGVFYFGKGVSQTVIATFTDWIVRGKQVYILSNTTSTNVETIKSYEKKGVFKGIHYTDILTSGQFAYEDIQRGNLPLEGNKFYVFGTANFRKTDPLPTIFKNSSYELVEDVNDADFIYCGIPQLLDADGCPYDSTEISDFTEQIDELVKTGLPLVSANQDMIGNEGGHFVVRQGTISYLWQEKGGKTIRYGKPDPRIFDALIARYCPNVPKKNILMIGDTLGTDIKGAKLAGIDGCLVLDGGVTEYNLNNEKITLLDYINKEGVEPDYVIDKVSQAPLF